jgi:hypothetical protein
VAEKLSRIECEAIEWLYGGDRDVEIVCWSAAWVRTRCKQKCISVMHKGPMKQPVGSRMVLERARVDGQFGSCYTCENCVKNAIGDLKSH